MRKSLTKQERLKRKSDFDRVFSSGLRVKGSGSRLVVLKNGLDHTRFAVSPAKKYGTAVERNRAKRMCKEAFRNSKDRILTGYDIIMVVYPGSDSYAEREGQLKSLASRASLFSAD